MYRVQEVIAHGGLARVYTAIAPTGTVLALKKHVTKHVVCPMLRHEACAMEILKGHPSIPFVDAWGRSQYYEYLTMQLLGPSTDDLFKDGKRLDIRTAAHLAVQMLDVVSHIHSRHVIHSDIKPGNFVLGVGECSERVYLVDFGFASFYCDPQTLVHRPLQTDQKFRGTRIYASLNLHRHQSASRRDDMESLAYTFLEFSQGTLPWHDIRNFAMTGLEKESWTGAELWADIPSVFGNFLDYARGLGFEEEPDYSRWRQAFGALASDASLADPAAPTKRAFDRRANGPSKPSSYSEDDYGVSGSSDNNWYPEYSGPAPHGVAVGNLFGDEDALILKAVSLMAHVPVMLTRDIYNGDEQLIPVRGVSNSGLQPWEPEST
ncbi:kinase-like domain-containing protein [Mycena capillaripes]|nr:kinase-like domain-containing protein [Mycena capillaripes]